MSMTRRISYSLAGSLLLPHGYRGQMVVNVLDYYQDYQRKARGKEKHKILMRTVL